MIGEDFAKQCGNLRGTKLTCNKIKDLHSFNMKQNLIVIADCYIRVFCV